MKLLLPIVGVGLIALALVDIFLTVIYARSGTAILSERLAPWTWKTFRLLTRPLHNKTRDWVLSFCGPVVLVLLVSLWVGMLVVGFALVIWPRLGTSMQTLHGQTPTDLSAALYASGSTMTTVGSGDLQAQTPFFRLLTMVESVIGITVITMTLTYFLQVYQALLRRNTLALALHHATGCTGDAAELVKGLGTRGNFEGVRTELTKYANEFAAVYEAHHLYSTLLYFRFAEMYYAPARLSLLMMDTATLIKCALDEKRYDWLRESGAVTQLWEGGMFLLKELSCVFLPGEQPEQGQRADEKTAERWKQRYLSAAARFRAAGIATVDDRRGADAYVEMRSQWCPFVSAFADYMAHEFSQIEPSEARA